MVRSGGGMRLRAVVFQNGIADGNALVANVSAWVIRGRGDQFGDCVLRFMAERAFQDFVRSGATLHLLLSRSLSALFGCNRPGSWPRLSFKHVQSSYLCHFNLNRARAPSVFLPTHFRNPCSCGLLMLVDDLVDDAVFLALLRVHNEVAFHVALDLIELLAGVLGEDVVHGLAHA